MPVESDEELVLRARRGDRDAFGQLVDRYERLALAVARSIARSWDDASDIVQDAFVTAYQRLNALLSPKRFGMWFLRSVRRQALWHLRRNACWKRREPIKHDPPARLATESDFNAAAFIARLPAQECVAVSLRHLHDLDVAEVARITGRPIGTVTKQLSRAYARMREWLKDRGAS